MDAVLRSSYSPFSTFYDAPYPLTETTAFNKARGEELPQGAAQLNVCEPSGIWNMLWSWKGYKHPGLYHPDNSITFVCQAPMIEAALRFSGITDNPLKKTKKVVDVGCGIGGSSRYIAKKYGSHCQGITLSPIQVQRAQALSADEGLEDKVNFQVADALNQPFPDGQFDLVWSMESGEHMPDKVKFVSELARVAAPGATIVIVTWCHRDLLPSEANLTPDETSLLNKICNAYYLPSWCSAADYVKIANSLSLEDIKTADWSDYVAPFWPAVIRSAFTWKGFTSLLRTGWKTIKGALVMPLMIHGYNKKLIKFTIITCRKPA
ncbi:probable tocopherol O-methyltransferase, chloroplastic isoform X1 [Zingiber officinale]|uniref:probable tocopherol O-methyltransferase, chloroplastic isoform X1 n=1 Tax=Zingiber officinale TaxID=94328 RepID=UPI001C4DC1EF|nr:probable tocopherol O-methyltransferase, chloroplastic isoform X1 [Zingiber officinale]